MRGRCRYDSNNNNDEAIEREKPYTDNCPSIKENKNQCFTHK
jgi:hypothetical protein